MEIDSDYVMVDRYVGYVSCISSTCVCFVYLLIDIICTRNGMELKNYEWYDSIKNLIFIGKKYNIFLTFYYPRCLC